MKQVAWIRLMLASLVAVFYACGGEGMSGAPETPDGGTTTADGTGDNGDDSGDEGLSAFRVNELVLVDPAIQGEFDLGGVVTIPVDLSEQANSFFADGIADGELNFVLVFQDLDPASESSDVEVLTDAVCTDAACGPGERESVATAAANKQEGSCSAVVPDTFTGTPPDDADAPCFSAAISEFAVDAGIFELVLGSPTVVGGYVASDGEDDSLSLDKGLIAGFISEADAAEITYEGFRLSEVLRDADKDTRDGIDGWWIYLSYQASQIAWDADISAD